MRTDENMIPQENERELERLFAQYRHACGSPEPDRNFMPGLWQKIEARQSKSVFFERIARTFVAGTMAACGFLGMLMLVPSQQPSAFPNASFVEDLTNASARETAPYVEPVRFDFNQDNSAESAQ